MLSETKRQTKNTFRSGCTMTKTRSTRIGACAALALATASIASTSIPSIAAAQERNRVWGLDCAFSDDTEQALRQHMNENAAPERLTPERQVAFVLIYSLEGNGGQQLTDGEFTGPVICRAPGVNIDQILQTDNTPRTDVLDVENALSVRYGTTNIKNRYCLTVDANNDCFDIGEGE
jgi:hypothetical protein